MSGCRHLPGSEGSSEGGEEEEGSSEGGEEEEGGSEGGEEEEEGSGSLAAPPCRSKASPGPTAGAGRLAALPGS